MLQYQNFRKLFLFLKANIWKVGFIMNKIVSNENCIQINISEKDWRRL